MRLHACRWRLGDDSPDEGFVCAHPHVHALRGRVTASVCAACAHCDRENGLATSPGADGIARCQLPIEEVPDARAGTFNWAVGMTTAPRARPTLERSLRSLIAAGWISPRLFAEPHTRLPELPAPLSVTHRDGKLGAFPNWYLGLSELFQREPLADAYLMCQDDALFSEGSREYLERALWPAAEVGVVSIYTPTHWSKGRPRGFHVENRGWASWGALAYIFPNQSLRALLTHPLLVLHRRHGAAEGTRNIDSVVGAWCAAAGLPYFVHVPSLVQHVGETSTIWRSASATGPRRAGDFMKRIV